MARIVYGVSGEGSGHSSRARELASFLIAQGHDVRLASYDRGYRNLSPDFPTLEIEGLTIGTRDNKVSLARTFTQNLARLPAGWKRTGELRRFLREFEPHVVLSDFEPATAHLARHLGLPLVSVDNQHRMRYMRYPRPAELALDAHLTETVIRLMVPPPDLALVSTFWFGEVKNDRTRLFPPILRRAVRETAPTAGEHVLVYATKVFPRLLDVLRGEPRVPFRVYGFEREGEEGHLSFRRFSLDGFLADLASARAVVGTAGFTLITEALHLRKPYLALPMRGQFEQELNALLLERLGLGRRSRDLAPSDLARFLDDLPALERARAAYDPGDPRAIYRALDELCRDDAAQARLARERRRASA